MKENLKDFCILCLYFAYKKKSFSQNYSLNRKFKFFSHPFLAGNGTFDHRFQPWNGAFARIFGNRDREFGHMGVSKFRFDVHHKSKSYQLCNYGEI